MAKINTGTITADGSGIWTSNAIDFSSGAKRTYMSVNGTQVSYRDFNVEGVVTANHLTVDASVIPLTNLNNARALDVFWQHKSVGSGITDAIRLLATQNPSRYSVECIGWPYWWTDEHGGHDGVPPAPSWYLDHDGIGNSEGASGGDVLDKVAWFNTAIRTTGYGAVVDVAFMKLCFTDMWWGTGQEIWDQYRTLYLSLMASYPAVKFVWATMPLTNVGSASDPGGYGVVSYDFNNLLRAYLNTNGGFLYDVADIESYDVNNVLSLDQHGWPSVVPAWADNADPPHPSVACNARLAHAWWYLMARISGWSP